MEIRITTSQILNILYILTWIILIGLCIEAFGFIFTTLYTYFGDPEIAKKLWIQIDLSALYKHDRGYFLVVSGLIAIVSILKALMFYLIMKILHDKKLNMAKPFNPELTRFIIKITCIAFGIGLFSGWGVKHTRWFVEKGVQMPDIQNLRFAGADVWIFMGVTLLVIAQIFKKGIEIQTENDLTV